MVAVGGHRGSAIRCIGSFSGGRWCVCHGLFWPPSFWHKQICDLLHLVSAPRVCGRMEKPRAQVYERAGGWVQGKGRDSGEDASGCDSRRRVVQSELDDAIAAPQVIPAPFNYGLYPDEPLRAVIDLLEEPESLLSPLEGVGYEAVGSAGGSKVGPSSPADEDCFRVVDGVLSSTVDAAEQYFRR